MFIRVPGLVPTTRPAKLCIVFLSEVGVIGRVGMERWGGMGGGGMGWEWNGAVGWEVVVGWDGKCTA